MERPLSHIRIGRHIFWKKVDQERLMIQLTMNISDQMIAVVWRTLVFLLRAHPEIWLLQPSRLLIFQIRWLEQFEGMRCLVDSGMVTSSSAILTFLISSFQTVANIIIIATLSPQPLVSPFRKFDWKCSSLISWWWWYEDTSLALYPQVVVLLITGVLVGLSWVFLFYDFEVQFCQPKLSTNLSANLNVGGYLVDKYLVDTVLVDK